MAIYDVDSAMMSEPPYMPSIIEPLLEASMMKKSKSEICGTQSHSCGNCAPANSRGQIFAKIGLVTAATAVALSAVAMDIHAQHKTRPPSAAARMLRPQP
jgi:hypothetical protein